MRARTVLFVARAGVLGRSPVAPGTMGTLAGVLIAFMESGASRAVQALVLAGVTVASMYIAGEAAAILGRRDPPSIVCDEVAGYLAAAFLIPFTPLNALITFALFRVFDITKPYPVSLIDRRVGGGAGVVLDDTAAGIYANICTRVILALLR